MQNYKFLFLILFFSLNLFSETVDHLRIDDGYKISIFANDIGSPRQLAEGADGTVYVGSRSSGRIYAIRDTDNNGVIDEKILIAKDLTYATGVSLHQGSLYFSEIDKIWKIEDISQQLKDNNNSIPEKVLVTDNLPSDKWHGWKWIKHDQEGNLYTNVGAPCNVCESKDKRFASILRLKNNSWEYVARGVRNSVGFDFHPTSQKLYFTDNGRDWLGDDSPSCELNKVDSDGGFFGFPYKHAKNISDPEFGDLNPGFSFIDPIAELGAHVAPTGMTFYNKDMFNEFKNDILITLHGSWNRSSKVGYKVIRVSLDDEGNVSKVSDFITGWLQEERVLGRPSSPFVMSDGSILIADDKADLIYRITKS
jgi:glucose/arabinose dehydrogenase